MTTSHSLVTGFSLTCELWDNEEITEVGFIKQVESLGMNVQGNDKVVWSVAVRNILGFHPNFPIRPVPLP